VVGRQGQCALYVGYTCFAQTSRPERQVEMMVKTSVQLILERMCFSANTG
jgi:hypothetical protein